MAPVASGRGCVFSGPCVQGGSAQALHRAHPFCTHLALPAPLVSEVVYVKIKPLETDACPCLGENPRIRAAGLIRPSRAPRHPAFFPVRRGGAESAGARRKEALALGASCAFGSANGQLTWNPVPVPMAARRARLSLAASVRPRVPASLVDGVPRIP